MRVHRRVLVCLLWLAAFAVPRRAEAQQISLLQAGTRVRVTGAAAGSEPFTGTVLRLVTDTLVIATESGNALITLPASGIMKLEVSDGRDRVRWGFTGAGAGAVLLGLGSAVALKKEDPSGLASFVGLLAGGVVGGALGGVIGAIAAPEDWRSYPLPRSVGAVAP